MFFQLFLVFSLKKFVFIWFLCFLRVKVGFDEGREGVFSIKRRKRIAVSDIFLNFAFAILVGCMGDDIVSCLFIYIIRYRR